MGAVVSIGESEARMGDRSRDRPDPVGLVLHDRHPGHGGPVGRPVVDPDAVQDTGQVGHAEVVGLAAGCAGAPRRPPEHHADGVRKGGGEPSGGRAAADRNHDQYEEQSPAGGQAEQRPPLAGVERPQGWKQPDAEDGQLKPGQAEEPADPIPAVVAVHARHDEAPFS